MLTIVNKLKKIFKFIFRERGREGEKEGEEHQCERKYQSVASPMCPDLGLNLQPGHVP